MEEERSKLENQWLQLLQARQSADEQQPLVHVPQPDSAKALPSWRRHLDIQDPLSSIALDESARTEREWIARQRQLQQQALTNRQAAHDAQVAANQERAKLAVFTETELRQRLKNAIDEHEIAEINLTVARDYLNNAKRDMDEADAKLSRYATLDDEIIAARVNSFKDPDAVLLPSRLAEARQAKVRAAEDADVCHKAYDALQKELSAAQAEVQRWDVERSKIAALVIAKHADFLSIELADVIDRLVELRRQLASLGAVWFSTADGRTTVMTLSPKAKHELNRFIETPGPAASYQTSVRDWHKRLLTDADAEMAQ